MAHYQFEASNERATLTSSRKEEFTLYINNLPEELNQVGLKQIFNHYGDIIGHFYRANTSWAYITYGSYKEAESAIKDLHNRSPLYLNVSFAREKASNGIQMAKAATSEDANKEHKNYREKGISSATELRIQTKGRGKPMDVFKEITPNPGLPAYNYTTNDDLLYSYSADPSTFNPYQNTDPYASTNTLWTRGQLTITQDRKRHVSLGRGYTMYEIPDPNPEIQNQISKIHEQRTSGLYEYGRDTLQNAIGNCQKCSKMTKFTCERCHSFYCSRNCQVEDWPRHKTECQAIPALVTAVSSLQTSNEEQVHNRNAHVTQVPLRRPKKLIDTMVSSEHTISNDINKTDLLSSVCNNNTRSNELKSSYSNTKDQQNVYQKTEANEGRTPSIHEKYNPQYNRGENDNKFEVKKNHTLENVQSTKIEKQNDHTQESYKMASERSGSSESIANMRNNFNANDVRKIEEDIAFPDREFLSKTKFTNVRIVVKMDREFWIQRVNDDDALIELMTNLQCEAEKAQTVKPIVGNVYAVKYENVWHRAMVTSLSPLKVLYIDYGNEEPIETEDFRDIQKDKNVPRFSAKIRLSQKANEKYKSLNYEDEISVKMISVDSNKVINVKLQDEDDIPILQEAQTNSVPKPNVPTNRKVDKIQESPKAPDNNKVQGPLNKLKSIVNNVPPGEEGILEIHAELSNNTYSATCLPNKATTDFEKLLVQLPPLCEQLAENSNHRPEIGEIVCGQRLDGDWLRGYVLSLESPLKMAIVDEARMMEISKTVSCPEMFLNIYAFGVQCEIIDSKHKFSSSDQHEFKVKGYKNHEGQDRLEIEILKGQDKLRAVLKPWVPMPEQKGVQYAKLRSGSEVCLTSYRNQNVMYARSLHTEELEHYNRIMQSVAKCAQTAPSLKEPPVVGQMVIAQYTDDNNYRAIVTKVQDEKIAVAYVDFGNTEVTSIKKLKVLNDDLKQLRSCTMKIVLKDVPEDVPMTKEANDYLIYLVGTEVPLMCTFDGALPKDGAFLKLPNGDNVNEKIRTLLVPSWKKDEDDKTCYMVHDLAVVSLGKVGDVTDAVVLDSFEDGYKYAMCPLDEDLMTHIYNILPKAMTAFCETTNYYIPREKELCLACYKGVWYRACCEQRSETPTTSFVFYVDFGNFESVKHTDLRLMPKDFMTPDALASICTIVNLAPTDSNGCYSPEIEKRVKELVTVNSSIKIKIVESDEENGIYSVELPYVRMKLIEEGLLSK